MCTRHGDCRPGAALQILNWLATFKPRQLAHAAAVPDVVRQLCSLAAEEHPQDTHATAEDAAEDCPPPRLFAPQVRSHAYLLGANPRKYPRKIRFFG